MSEISHLRNRHLLAEALERFNKPCAMHDRASFSGSFAMKRVWLDGSEDVVVSDENLVVTLGRRVMSRLISGAAGTPSVLRTTQEALRVVRSTTGSPDTAHLEFAQVTGTNEYRLRLFADDSAELTLTFLAGQQTISTLAAAISAVSGWQADVVNSLGSLDAVSLFQTPNLPALGTQATYVDASATPESATLYATSTQSQSIVPNDISLLKVGRIRFGTQGFSEGNSAVGRDVLAVDEQLRSPLRPTDYGVSGNSENYLSTTPSYVSDGNVTFSASLPVTAGNGLLLSEAGLYTDGDFMVAKKNFGQIAKTNLFELRTEWTLLF